MGICYELLLMFLLGRFCNGSSATTHHNHCNISKYIMRITQPDCDEVLQPTDTCAGVCASSSQPDENLIESNRYSEQCSCCEPIGRVEMTTVTLNCTKGMKEMTVQIPRVTACACRPCGKRYSTVGAATTPAPPLSSVVLEEAAVNGSVSTPTGETAHEEEP